MRYWGFVDDVFTGPPTGAGLSLDEVCAKSQQFTGLKDKHGKDIFEGDVLNIADCEIVGYHQNEYGESPVYADSIGKVHYVGAGFCFDGHSAGDLPLDSFDPKDMEIIGNIFEHKHLLE